MEFNFVLTQWGINLNSEYCAIWGKFFMNDFQWFTYKSCAVKSQCHPFPVFTCLQYKTLENTMEKGEIAFNEQILLFPKRFLPIRRSFCHFYQIWNCRLQTLLVWKSLKFVVWERVNKERKFGLVQIQSIFRRQIKDDWNGGPCFKLRRKHCGKRRKCRLPAFSAFFTMFSKGWFSRAVKTWDSLVKS